MKINAYHLLLTSSRDATIIYIPDKLTLKGTWDLFIYGLKIPVLQIFRRFIYELYNRYR